MSIFTYVGGLQALRDSDVVEISGDQLWLRTRHNPERWAIEGTAPNTFSSLKVDVPEFVPGQIYVNVQETGKLWWTVLFLKVGCTESNLECCLPLEVWSAENADVSQKSNQV